MSSSQFSMKIPEELKISLVALSEISHRSQSYLATKAIAEYITRNEWKIKALHEAKLEADKGIFISQNAMESWVNSLDLNNKLPVLKPDIVSHI